MEWGWLEVMEAGIWGPRAEFTPDWCDEVKEIAFFYLPLAPLPIYLYFIVLV
jgi:hypothetical protein